MPYWYRRIVPAEALKIIGRLEVDYWRDFFTVKQLAISRVQIELVEHLL